MTVEQTILLRALSDYINKKKTPPIPEKVDLDILVSYGKKHEVIAILYHQTKHQMLHDECMSTVYSNTIRLTMIQKLISNWDFPFFIIKGLEVAKLYPVPSLRTMGDIDIVVQTENREYAHSVLIKQGYNNISKCLDREWQYYKNKMEFELHDRLIYHESVNNPLQEQFFNNFWIYVHDNHIDWDFHFLFLLYHLRKHLMNKGVGFRQFMDIAVVAKYAKLDWKWIEEKAKELELLTFLRTVLTFCHRWFETETPIELVELTDEFYVSATEKIFEDGVFGFNNEENASSAAVNVYRKRGMLGNVIHAINVVFPSYSALRVSQQYSFVDHKLFLVPVAWIYRAIKHRKKAMIAKQQIKSSFASKEQIRKREEMYKQWGL